MTEQEKRQLSRDVAEKLGIRASRRFIVNSDDVTIWLHDDSARCFDLMVQHGIWPEIYGSYVVCGKNEEIKYADHSPEQEATRIAILKALLAKD